MTPLPAPFRWILILIGIWFVGRAGYFLWSDRRIGMPGRGVTPIDAVATAIPTPSARHSAGRLRIAAIVPAGGLSQRPDRSYPRDAHSPDAPAAVDPAASNIAVPAPAQPGDPSIAPSFAVGVAVPTPAGSDRSRWSGSLWLFDRRDQGPRGLAAGGQLGGGQAGARIAYRVTAQGAPLRIDLAGRASRALRGPGDAEAAIAADLYPLRDVPLRVSVERRVAIDRGGRDAWAASLAGGFHRGGLPLGMEADGYAQGGIVGARSRDAFVDGALRIVRPFALGKGARLLVGGGIWGAAQPGLERLDLGPRIALALPIARAVATLAIEGRMRAAGDARPGSAVAMVAGVDF